MTLDVKTAESFLPFLMSLMFKDGIKKGGQALPMRKNMYFQTWDPSSFH